jgi:hypothetical protein
MKERIAQEGFWLTQASLDNENNRTFVRRVCGFGDLDNLFTEWSDSQKAEWEKEHPQEEEIN